MTAMRGPSRPGRARSARGETPAQHRDGRGARRSRREEGEYREYSTDEQRRAAGCIARRMPWAFRHGLLAGVRLRYLPPYSHDFNPIESAWALVKKHIKTCAPRHWAALRRVARAARHAVRPLHCHRWFAHAGYGDSSTFRD